MRTLIPTFSIALALTVAGIARAQEAPPATPQIPPFRPPPCADPEGEGSFVASTGCSGVFGLRGSSTTVQGAAASEGTGLMLSGEGEEFVRRGVFSAHGTHRLAIGGGGAGFEGTVMGSIAGGFRFPMAERHGPVLRAGVSGYVRGNDAFYASLLELPQLQMGYQYMSGATVFELGMTTGAVLIGRSRLGDTEPRHLGAGLEAGGYLAVHVPWFRLGMTATRLPTQEDLLSPVRVAEGTLCAISRPVAICADGRATWSDVIATPGIASQEARSLYAGLVLGFTRER